MIFLNAFRSSYREKIKEQLQSAGYVVAMSVSENDINALKTAADFGGEAYIRLCRTMERAFPIIREGGKVVGAVSVGADTYVVDEMLDSMQNQIILAITAVILLIWIASGET